MSIVRSPNEGEVSNSSPIHNTKHLLWNNQLHPMRLNRLVRPLPGRRDDRGIFTDDVGQAELDQPNEATDEPQQVTSASSIRDSGARLQMGSGGFQPPLDDVGIAGRRGR
jgi:hypothetical protein